MQRATAGKRSICESARYRYLYRSLARQPDRYRTASPTGRYGAAKSRTPEHNQNLVLALLNTLPILDMNLLAAERFGVCKTHLERSGRIIADADLLIASICLAQGAVLVTGNRRHYERIAGLQLEDWIVR